MFITANPQSKEMIAPSSPTPKNLRKLQLSFLDQLAPPIYIHIILYYKSPPHHLNSQNLKRSLSDALARYYPLAGRLRDHDTWVECNDSGAEYREARFDNLNLSDMLENPKLEELHKHVPASAGPGVPLSVQVNFFGCGGIAIGVCVSHRVADATSMVDFVNAWADVSSSLGDRQDRSVVAAPKFDMSLRFPPADFSKYFPSSDVPVRDLTPVNLPKVVTRKLVFEEKKIDLLRKMASGPMVKKPTRVEAVSAFIWRHLIEAASLNDDARNRTVYAASYAVDIRARARPPLPQQIFGNACARAMAMTTTTGRASPKESGGYYELVVKLRDAMKKADAGYAERLEDGDAFLEYYSKNEENASCFKDGSKGLEICFFTSWCRLRAYDADFGSGKPDWVSIIGVPQKNLVFFLGTKCGDGIEAWLNVAEEGAEMIETAYNLLGQVMYENEKVIS